MTQIPEEELDPSYTFLECCACPYTVMVTTKNEKDDIVVMAGGFQTNPTAQDLVDYRKKADEVGGKVWVYAGMYPVGFKTDADNIVTELVDVEFVSRSENIKPPEAGQPEARPPRVFDKKYLFQIDMDGWCVQTATFVDSETDRIKETAEWMERTFPKGLPVE